MTNGQDGDIARGFTRFFQAFTSTSRRARAGIAVCSLLVLGPALFVAIPSSGTADSACDALRNWARAYEGTSPTLDDVARFDRAHRVAIFNAIAPAVRASLWQEQLRRFHRQSDLSDTQRALIIEGISLTTPALYEQDAAAKQALDRFWNRAQSSFSAAPLKRRFYEFGPVASGFESEKPVPSVWEKLSNTFRANAGYGSCTCLPGQPPPCGVGSCVEGGCAQRAGCGIFLVDVCTGVCVQ